MANLLESLALFVADLRAKKQGVLEDAQLARDQARATEQGPGLARTLRAVGMGPENPAAAAAVRMMMEPSTRSTGAAMAQGLLAQLAQSQSPEGQARLGLIDTQQQAAQVGMARDLQAMQQAEEMGPLQMAAQRSLIAQRQAAAEASRASALAAATGRITDASNRITQTFLREIQAPSEVGDAVQQIDQSLGTGDSLGALAAVVKLAKVLDPTSVVREGEVTTVQGGTGVAEGLIAQYNRLFSKGFSQAGAEQFRRVARAVAAPVLQRGLRVQQDAETAARMTGSDPAQVVLGAGWRRDFVERYLQGAPDAVQQTDYAF